MSGAGLAGRYTGDRYDTADGLQSVPPLPRLVRSRQCQSARLRFVPVDRSPSSQPAPVIDPEWLELQNSPHRCGTRVQWYTLCCEMLTHGHKVCASNLESQAVVISFTTLLVANTVHTLTYTVLYTQMHTHSQQGRVKRLRGSSQKFFVSTWYHSGSGPVVNEMS